MGRIQKKKPAGGRPKRKSETAEATTVSQSANSAPARNAQAGAVARQQVKSPQAYPGKKYIDSSMQFLREVRVELRKVTWPSRKQTVGSTVVVIVLVLIISAFLGVVDFGLSSLVQVVLQ
jgi:preprotein translocase subunit SecE